MKQILFVRPDTREDGKIWWCESGSQQVDSLHGWQALDSLADHQLADRVCLLIPASEMIFRHFSLPKKGLSSQGTPFSWMAEETLIGDVDTLHWTVLRKKGREVDAVAIAADRLQHWLNLMADAGLTVVQALPDAMLLPGSEGGSTLVSLEESYWLRYPPFNACELDAGLLSRVVGSHDAGALRCYGDVPSGVDATETLPWQHPLILIQPQWKQCRVNVLHGTFSPRGGKAQGIPHARKVMAAMALLSVGLLLGPRIATALMLVEQENLAQQEMTQVAQHYFPTLRQTTNLKYHFGQSVKKEKKGVFLQIEALEQIKQSVPSVEVNQLEYDDVQKQMTLNLRASSLQGLQEFINRTGSEFDFTMQPISREAPFTAIVTGKYK